MKKHLIAAAVAAAVAVPAAAQVTVYGLIDHSYQSLSSKSAASVKTDSTDAGVSGALSGGRLGFRGNEDLGGGLKAGFVFETSLTSDTGAIGANARLSFVELGGSFGTVRMGRQVSPQKAVMDANYASGNAGFTAGLPGIDLDVDGERVSEAITFISPNFSGVTLQIQHAGAKSDADNAANLTSTQQNNFGIFYSAGPLSVGIAQNKVDAKAEAGNQDETTYTAVGARYNFGPASLHVTNSQKETERSGTAIAADAEETTVGVKVPMGSWLFVAQISDAESNALGAAAKTNYDGYQLHAIYNLSKRTNVYALYGDDSSQAAGAAKATRDGSVSDFLCKRS